MDDGNTVPGTDDIERDADLALALAAAEAECVYIVDRLKELIK